ncbi:hypothetical protein KAU09_05055 [Candidatus Parcubacteria bacterium]|nr:hypothetical protein [Candidatus Parcubacteria bacterium]
MKKCRILLIVFSLLLLPKFVFALGQMTAPIIVENALRGEKIQQEVIAVNSDKEPMVAKFSAEGQIKDWVKFFLSKDLKNQFATATIPAQGTLRAIAIIDVPVDILNGEYKGAISVSSVVDGIIKSEESGATVLQKIDRLATIIVSDKEEINLKNTSVIPSDYDLNIGEPLSIRIIYDNQGNVSMSPHVRLRIKKDNKNVHDIIYPYPEEEPAVNPGSQREIKAINVQSVGWEEGKYSAELEFLHNNQVLLEKEFQFSVFSKNSSLTGFIKNIFFNDYYSLVLLAFLLLLIIAWQIKKNIKIRKELKKSK